MHAQTKGRAIGPCAPSAARSLRSPGVGSPRSRGRREDSGDVERPDGGTAETEGGGVSGRERDQVLTCLGGWEGSADASGPSMPD